MHPSVNPDFANRLLQPPAAKDDKYSRGIVGFATGSSKYPGAALLGINAAFELAIGMVCYQGPDSVKQLVLGNRPEVVIGLEKSQALVLGSGVEEGDAEQARLIKEQSQRNLPMVIDAGALQLVDFEKSLAPSVLTPHYAEAAKLLAKFGKPISKEEIQADSASAASLLAELTGQVVLLKGSITQIAISGFEPIESGPGSTYLATAGTGDVLAGMIGTLIAKAITLEIDVTVGVIAELALIATQLHSEAAEIAARKGEFGASAVSRAISEALID